MNKTYHSFEVSNMVVSPKEKKLSDLSTSIILIK